MNEYRDTEHVVTHKVDAWVTAWVGLVCTIVGAVAGYFTETRPLLATLYKQEAIIEQLRAKDPTSKATLVWAGDGTLTAAPIKPTPDLCDTIFTGNTTHKRTIINIDGPQACELAYTIAPSMVGEPEGVITVEPHKPKPSDLRP